MLRYGELMGELSAYMAEFAAMSKIFLKIMKEPRKHLESLSCSRDIRIKSLLIVFMSSMESEDIALKLGAYLKVIQHTQTIAERYKLDKKAFLGPEKGFWH